MRFLLSVAAFVLRLLMHNISNNNNMKKLILSVGLTLGIVFSSNAVLITSTNGLAAAGVAVLPTMLGGSCQVRYILLTSPSGTQSASCQIYDTPYTGTWQTNAAYTSATRYFTNGYVTTWTNYYGATNTFTNIVMVSALTTNVAASNALSAMFTLTAPTNLSAQFENLNANFNRGIMVTNTGVGPLYITVGYLQ